MDSIIQEINNFNNTFSLSPGQDRNDKRFEIINNIKNIINELNIMFDINGIVKNKDNGVNVFAMILINLKIQNYKKYYYGEIITDNILNFLIKQLYNDSNYIKNIARELFTMIINNDLLSKDQIIIFRNFIINYYNKVDKNNSDYNKIIEWIHEILLLTSNCNKNSLLGCIIGKCVGDSLGFIVEGHGPNRCSEFVNEFVLQKKYPEWVRCSSLKYGQYSDDSQLTRELLISLLMSEKGKIETLIYAKQISKLFIPNNYRIVGYGRTCAKAGEAIYNGQCYKTTGCTESYGNGSAMRSAPIGILFNKKEDIIDISRKLSSITHSNPRCMSCSSVIALANKFAMACKNIEFNIDMFIKYISQTEDESLNNYIKLIPSLIQNNISRDEVCKKFVKIGMDDGEGEWDGISPGVTQTILWSLYSFCKYPNSFIDCIAEAIAVGGDVDTTAAISGAISGSRLGDQQIPEVWKYELNDLNEWNYTDLCNLVNEVFKIVNNNDIKLIY